MKNKTYSLKQSNNRTQEKEIIKAQGIKEVVKIKTKGIIFNQNDK